MNDHPLESLINQYLDEKDITKETRELFHTVLFQHLNYLQENNILYPSTRDVLAYIEWKKHQGFSSSWMYNQVNTLKGFYRYLAENQTRLNLPVAYAYDITEPIDNVHLKRSVKHSFLTVEQAKQLIIQTKLNRRYIWQYRDHAIVYLMLTTGLRSVEIRRLRKKDFKRITNQAILFVQGKGRTFADEFVKLPEGVECAIRDYLSKRTDQNPYLFITHSHRSAIDYLSRTFFYSMFRRVLNESGLKGVTVTPHALRHTAATMNLLRGGSMEETKQLMRHATLSTTLIYAHSERLHDDSERKIEDYILEENGKLKINP